MEGVTEAGAARAAERGAEWASGRAAMAALGLLVLAVAADRLGIRVGGLNLRVEMLVAGLIVLWALLRSRGEALEGWGLVEWALAGWVVVNALSSVLFSPDTMVSLKNTAVVAGLFIVYLAAQMLLRSRGMLVWAAVAWVAVGASVGLLGVLSSVWYDLAGPNPGVLLERFYRDGVFIVTPKVQSTMWEPNLFGSYSLTVLALAFALSLAPEFREGAWRWLFAVSGALAAAGAMLSMTRTVWAVAPVLVLLAGFAALRLRLANPRQVALALLAPALVGGALGLGLGLSMEAPSWRMGEPWSLTDRQVDDMVREYMFGAEQSEPAPSPSPAGQAAPTAAPATAAPATSVPSTPVPATAAPSTSVPATPIPATPVPAGIGSAVGDRLGEVLNDGEVGSLEGRAAIYARAFEGWLQRPLLGWGAGAYPLVYPAPPGGGDWIANAELHALFDTGIVGLLLLAGAIGYAVVGAVRALRVPASEWGAGRYAAFGLLVAGVGLLLAYQLTDGTWLGFTWVLVAMMAAAGRYLPGRREA